MNLSDDPARAKGKILIVDDETETREVIKRFLQSQGFDVEAADCADKAVELIKDRKPELVFSDIRMPGMDGLVLLRMIKEQDPMTIVIMITGFASVHTAIEAMKKGADDFLMKPIDMGHLSLIAQKSFEKRGLALEISKTRDELKRLEELNRRLEEVNKLKDDFISTISHELNTPVTVITESASILKDKNLSLSEENSRALLEDISKQCSHLKRFVKNLLDVAVIQKSILAKERVDLRAVADEALMEARHYYGKKSVEVDFQKPEHPVIAKVDRNRIEEALYHLVANAIKFNKDNGRVVVSVDGGKDRVDIKVRDTGIGIQDAEKEKIFEKFYQVDHSATRKYAGAGVGLALVKKYVELHNGAVKVESVPGEGSVFTVSLPTGD